MAYIDRDKLLNDSDKGIVSDLSVYSYLLSILEYSQERLKMAFAG